MSEKTGGTTTATDGTTTEHEESGKEFQAITTQEDLDKVIQTRIARERQKFQDYDEVKAKAQQFDEAEEARKTDEQKRQERDAERDRELAELRTEKLRAEIAAAKSDPEKGIHVPAGLLRGSTREELEASADELIQFKGVTVEKPRVVVRREATTPANSKTNPAREAKRGWLQALLGDND